MKTQLKCLTINQAKILLDALNNTWIVLNGDTEDVDYLRDQLEEIIKHLEDSR